MQGGRRPLYLELVGDHPGQRLNVGVQRIVGMFLEGKWRWRLEGQKFGTRFRSLAARAPLKHDAKKPIPIFLGRSGVQLRYHVAFGSRDAEAHSGWPAHPRLAARACPSHRRADDVPFDCAHRQRFRGGRAHRLSADRAVLGRERRHTACQTHRHRHRGAQPTTSRVEKTDILGDEPSTNSFTLSSSPPHFLTDFTCSAHPHSTSQEVDERPEQEQQHPSRSYMV